MYHSKEIAELLEGVVDVYLADLRYGNDCCAKKYSKVDEYMKVVTENLTHAYSNAEILLRHLVLPGHLDCCTKPAVEWVATHIPHVRFNLMFQYTPHHLAYKYPEINKPLARQEMEKAIEIVLSSGLEDVLV
jgi:putative pyruvate formate lyase activating enzyme